MYRPKVYTASKIRHALWWQQLAQCYPEIEFTARWIHQPPGPDHDSTFWSEEQKTLHWIQDIQDVQRSDYVVGYCDIDDDAKLSGTIGEMVGAICLGKVVFALGFADRHSWQAHPLVKRMPADPHAALCHIIGRP